jgi:hypothetical protein
MNFAAGPAIRCEALDYTKLVVFTPARASQRPEPRILEGPQP